VEPNVWTERSRSSGRASRASPTFPAALLLSEILVLATGEGGEALAEWERAARRAAERREPVEAEVKTRAPRRRRRRR
jgi:hypothetical protein